MRTTYATNPFPEKTSLSQNDRLSTYTAQLKQVQAQLPGIQSRRQWAGLGILLCLVPAIACGWLALAGGPAWPAALLVVLLCMSQLIRLYRQAGEKWKQFAAQEESLERGIARLNNSWQTLEETGLEFARPDHLYQEDLQVLGSGSLFTLLATTRSRVGAECLAVYLLDPVDAKEVRLRQESVRELAQATGIREQMQLLGSYQEQDCTAGDFTTWLDSPLLRTPIAIPCILLGTSAIFLALIVGIWVGALAWYPAVLPAAALLLVQTCVAALHFKRIRPHFRRLRQMMRSLTVLRQGLRLMEELEFCSPKLRHMTERLRKGNAATNVRTFEKLVRALDQREKHEFYLISHLCAVGTQLVFATDRWRAKHHYEFKEWLDIWAEFEALQALALYAFEHPQCVFPKLVEGDAMLGAKQLRHPLLPAATCVGNDVQLNPATRFYLVTGSNMAGKSTLLRAVGLNVVLAQAGAPVCAEAASFTNMQVCAAFSPRESLEEGRSRFLAEIARLRGALAQSVSTTPMLFLVDEILSGTNSHDRLTATKIILEAFLDKGAIGMISTHDLALTSLADNGVVRGMLMHMESADEQDPLAFDYLLKPGVSHNASALAIVRMMGIEVAAG